MFLFYDLDEIESDFMEWFFPTDLHLLLQEICGFKKKKNRNGKFDSRPDCLKTDCSPLIGSIIQAKQLFHFIRIFILTKTKEENCMNKFFVSPSNISKPVWNVSFLSANV